MKRRVVVLVISCVLLSAGLLSADSTAQPNLIVVISIDQMRSDYIPRFMPWLSKGGIARLIRDGAYFPNAAHRHSNTLTGPGHSTIGAGAEPRDHGIVANYWFDRIADSEDYCVDDPTVQPTADSTKRSSPWKLTYRGLGDAVKERHRGSKVIGVSMKDRSAILMAGRKADAAYWFDERPGVFMSSSYYEWNPKVLEFNDRLPGYLETHRLWELSGLIPSEDLERVTYDPDSLRKYKRDRHGLGQSFPHPIDNLDALLSTPFFDSIVIDFAMHVVRVEQLGSREGQTDVLFLGPSSLDYYGHNFGPDSMEVADGIVRLDRDIERFLTFLDENVEGSYTIGLTSDHGVQQIPEVALAQGKKAGRLSFPNPGPSAETMADLSPQRLALEREISKELELEMHDDSPIENAILRWAAASGLYLNWNKIAAHGIDPEVARKAVRTCVLRLQGVSGAWTASELLAATPAKTDVEEAVRRAYRPERSPDVVVALEPGYIFRSAGGTTHGQPVEADMRVPLILYGVGVKKGTYDGAAAPADMTRSLGVIVDAKVGSDDARILPCLASK